MQIIFLSRRYFPQIGGVETHVRSISKILIKQGHTVSVIVENDSNGFKYGKEVIDGVKIFSINTGNENRFKKFRIWKELFKYRRIIQKSDIIHCHDVFFWYLPFRLLYPSKKVFTTFHGYETKFPPSKKAIIIRKISEVLSNGNICVGEYIKKWYYTKPDYVLYGGVDIVKNSRFTNENSDKLKLVLIGRLDSDIGINTYLNSLQVLEKNKIKFTFYTYGEGKMANKVKKYGSVHKFSKEISKVIEKSDIVFCSSYLLMLQSLLNKKNVISVYENPLKEDYLRNSPFSSFVYICKNSKEIMDVIRIIIDAPWKNHSMIENGYNWAKEQTWEKVTDIYLALWKK